ncbi:MAG: ATP--guanido phosphotransferase [Victivallales bacterium]|nr:ATP--guanido phosphotransferase [Victivallales bacterium]
MSAVTLQDLAATALPWLVEDSSSGGIAVSSRIRLARNLVGFPFPNRASALELHSVTEQIRAAAATCGELAKATHFPLAELSAEERLVLLERRLVSAELHCSPTERAVLVAPDEATSLMVNEEDHLRLQVLLPGFRMAEALARARAVDTGLLAGLAPAFRRDLGFLTSCPTNLGTALRASVMLHVPGLALTGRLEAVSRALLRLGFAVRGAFGEGEGTVAHFVQVSNQSTLGETEDEIIADFEHYVRSLIWAEENARKHLLRERREVLYDHVGRAYAILRFAHYLTTKEALDCISALRLGVGLQLFDKLTCDTIQRLCRDVQPGHLQMALGSQADPVERDRLRAARTRAVVT